MLALDYGLLDQKYFQSLTPTEKIFIDHHILNRLIEAENKSQEEAMKKSKEKREHPGMERYETDEEFFEEIEAANKDSMKGYE